MSANYSDITERNLIESQTKWLFLCLSLSKILDSIYLDSKIPIENLVWIENLKRHRIARSNRPHT